MIDQTLYVVTPAELTALNAAILPEISASAYTFKSDLDIGGNHHIAKRRFDLVKTAVSPTVQTAMDGAINLGNILLLGGPEVIVLQSSGNILVAQDDSQVHWLQAAPKNSLTGAVNLVVSGSTTDMYGLTLSEGAYMFYITLSLQVLGDYQSFTLKLFKNGAMVQPNEYGSAQVRGQMASNQEDHQYCSFTTTAYVEVAPAAQDNYEWRVRQDSGAFMSSAFIRVIDTSSQWTVARFQKNA